MSAGFKHPLTYGEVHALIQRGVLDTHDVHVTLTGGAFAFQIVDSARADNGAVSLYYRDRAGQPRLAVCGMTPDHIDVCLDRKPSVDDGRTYSEADIVEKAPTSDAGRKYDAGKPDPTLLPPKALLEVVRGLTVGAQKYDRDNWHRVPGARIRYLGAALRHLLAYQSGEKIDEETQVNHLALAACSLLFLLGFDMGDAPEPPPLPTKKDKP